MNVRLKFITKEIFMAAVWAFLILLLIFSPGVWAGAVDFVYANF
jgi:hypothetical protein